MAVSQKARRLLAFGYLTAMLGFVAACGDDDGATILPPDEDDTGSITGVVTSSAGGAPIVGATVGTSPASSIALTDAQGRYTINGVPAGSVAVIANAPGFQAGVVSVTVQEDTTVTANIALTPVPAGVEDTLGIVTGLVLRRNGQPVPAGTQVRIFRDLSVCPPVGTGTPVATLTTDAGGRFVSATLPRGNYLACVNVTIGGQVLQGRVAFVINEGETTQADITVGAGFNQTTDPNIQTPPGVAGVPGTLVPLNAQGNFNGIITFIDIDADGDFDEDCNVIFTQHLWVVEVRQDLNNNGVVNAGEPAVSGVRVEWSLNQAGGGVLVTGPDGTTFVRGTTGVIVDTDDPFLDPFQAEGAKTASSNGISPQFKVDDTHAITYTNDTAQTVDFQGQNVTIGIGQTWIIVTSTLEGFTDVVAFSPDLSRSTFQCGEGVNLPRCSDKAFALKRWVNWRIEVRELTEVGTGGVDLVGGGVIGDTVGFRGGSSAGVRDATGLLTFTNRLDRSPVCPVGAPVGTDCDLDNRDFFGIVISRLRLDSPFTFINGSVEFRVTDDIPDVDIDDIDSDSLPGGPIFAGGGTIDVTENIGTAPFSMNSAVTFRCEPDPAAVPGPPPFGTPLGELCLDVDVTTVVPAGQTLREQGFTITPGAEAQLGAVAVTVSLDSLVFFAEVGPAGSPLTTPLGVPFVFSTDLNRLLLGQADLDAEFRIRVFDEFGEVCEEFRIRKRYITSILRLFKQGPVTVSRGQTFEYTVTVVNDGETESRDVIIADTLPILDVITTSASAAPGVLNNRLGNQAFRYITDDPTFDPAAIRYYVDADDNGPGTTTDYCLEAPLVLPAAFATPALCPVVFRFATVAQARTAAQTASVSGSNPLGIGVSGTPDQIVIVEYFDTSVLARTAPGGTIEAEDSFEITLNAFQSVNSFPLPNGTIPGVSPPRGTAPGGDQQNAEWCNIATVTSADLDFAADTVCTRVVEGLLEIRKTAADAIVAAGDTAEFLIEIANNGSEALTNVTVSDTLDAAFRGVPRIFDLGTAASGTGVVTFTPATPDSTTRIITFTVPTVPPGGAFFRVARIRIRSPFIGGQFCNRVTARVVIPSGTLTDTDISCIVTQAGIEFDIVNQDFRKNAAGEVVDAEIFLPTDSIYYTTTITNRSTTLTAQNVVVTWDIAAQSEIIRFVRILTATDAPAGRFRNPAPATPTCSPTAKPECSLTVAALGPGQSIIFDYLTFPRTSGSDVNRINLTADPIGFGPVITAVNEEPTTISNP